MFGYIYKKDVAIIAVVLCLCLGVGSFFDYQISSALFNIGSMYGRFVEAAGELPLAGLNLFNRARIRIRGERLGLESVTLSGGRITFLGVDVPKKVAFELKTRYGAVNFPKSRKLSVPYKAGAGVGSGLGRGLDANDEAGPVAAALMLLQQLGASDDE